MIFLRPGYGAPRDTVQKENLMKMLHYPNNVKNVRIILVLMKMLIGFLNHLNQLDLYLYLKIKVWSKNHTGNLIKSWNFKSERKKIQLFWPIKFIIVFSFANIFRQFSCTWHLHLLRAVFAGSNQCWPADVGATSC